MVHKVLQNDPLRNLFSSPLHQLQPENITELFSILNCSATHFLRVSAFFEGEITNCSDYCIYLGTVQITCHCACHEGD